MRSFQSAGSIRLLMRVDSERTNSRRHTFNEFEMSLQTSASTDAGLPLYRIAFVNTHPIQYFAPLYSYLTKYCSLDTTALYLSDFSLRGGADPGFHRSITWNIDLVSGYKPHFVGAEKASKRRIGGFFSMVAPQLWFDIRRGRYDAVIIHGHNLAAHHMALAACLSSGTPVFARSETHLMLQRPALLEAVRTPIMKLHYSAYDGFLAIGTANAEYYRSMGIAQERIFHVPYTVDNDRFIAASNASRSERNITRTKLGMHPELPAILYASKFEERKRPDDLLTAYTKLRGEGIAAQLVLVGAGVLEEHLKRRVASEAIPDVVFPGFINQSELPAVYGASDVFVLPSTNEPWGLVVNEAMCAGLPVIVSEEVGCAKDLVLRGENGETFTAGDISGLVAALRPILTNPDRRASYGRSSVQRIQQWSYAQCGTGIRAAIDSTLRVDKARQIVPRGK